MSERGVRGALLVVLLCAISAGLRALSPPRFVGTPDAAPSRLDALSAPFGDDLRGDCNAFLSLLARSLLREGWARTGGIPLLNVQEAETQHFFYYPNHTPGIPWVTAAAFTILGDTERTSRAVALLFSLLTTALVTGVCLRRLGLTGGLLAWLALSVLPAGWYWGTHLNYEVPTLPFAMLFLVLCTGPSPRWRLAAAALAAGFFFDLVALFAVGAMLPLWLLRRRPQWSRAGRWLLFGLALLVLWWVWQRWQLGRHGQHEALGAREHLFRISLLSPDLDVGEWLRSAAGHVVAMVGLGAVIVWLVELLLAHRESGNDRLGHLLRASSWLALLAIAIPAQRSLDHPYYALYFQLPVAIAVARLAGRAARWKPGTAGRALAVSLAAMIALTGVRAERDRPDPDPDRPAAHRLARELVEAQPDPSVQIVLPPGSQFNAITLAYYTDRPVSTLGPLDEHAVDYRKWLLNFGHPSLARNRVVIAEDPQWPGRGGYRELPIPPDVLREHGIEPPPPAEDE